MAFREKVAWSAFLTTLLIWGAYFAVVVAEVGAPAHGMKMVWLFVAATIAQAVLMGTATAIWAIRAPDEANARPDERDQAVSRRASGIAYLVLVLSVVAVIVGLHLGLHGSGTVFALIGAFILGEAARFGAQAIGYRRGAA
ncbi:hypothetical protein [Sphingomonas sp.]|uniref:hypothetical protein n=1 Tax=Sphingomonas sp. TaxID=28214 RepID=UPI002EDB8FBD